MAEHGERRERHTGVQVLVLGLLVAPGIWRHKRGQELFWFVHHVSASYD